MTPARPRHVPALYFFPYDLRFLFRGSIHSRIPAHSASGLAALILSKRGVQFLRGALHVAILLGDTEQIVVEHYSAWIESRQKPLDDAIETANLRSTEYLDGAA